LRQKVIAAFSIQAIIDSAPRLSEGIFRWASIDTFFL